MLIKIDPRVVVAARPKRREAAIAAVKGEFINYFSVIRPLAFANGTPDYIDVAGAPFSVELSGRTPEFISQALYLWISSHSIGVPQPMTPPPSQRLT